MKQTRYHRDSNAENKLDVKERLYCAFNVRYDRTIRDLSCALRDGRI